MVFHKDTLGEQVRFDYDIVGNITKITWLSDNSSETIEYNATRDFVTRVVDRNGLETVYRQEKNPADPTGYIKQIVSVKPPQGQAEQRSYEFWFKNKPNGERYKYKQKTTVNGEVVTTVFNECCGKPIEEISSVKGKTTYDYNEKGLISRQVYPDGTSKSFTYHPKLNKVTQVTEVTKNAAGKPQTTWVKVSYDERTGTIRTVQNSQNQSLVLSYDSSGRVTKIVDAKTNELTFSYNAMGRPTKITQKGVGSVAITYDAAGNVQGADSPQGRVVAMRVSQLMQNLLGIVRPVGVSIGP
jgi:YD repeat-containing protein